MMEEPRAVANHGQRCSTCGGVVYQEWAGDTKWVHSCPPGAFVVDVFIGDECGWVPVAVVGTEAEAREWATTEAPPAGGWHPAAVFRVRPIP